MAKAESNMLPLGTKAPIFNLTDTRTDERLSYGELKGEKGTVIMFICNHCPYVIHVQDCLVEMAEKYQTQGIGFVAISSNDVENYPQDAPDLMKTHAEKYNFSFPYLYDETQEVAKAYMAACTPDFYVFDNADGCVYRGRMDGATPGNQVAVTGLDLIAAIEGILDGKAPQSTQIPSLGCGIKWKTA